MRCAGCAAEIPKARLEAVPWTQHCILCVTEIEVRNSGIITAYQVSVDEALKEMQIDEPIECCTAKAADDRADNLLGRQIDRLEGFDES